MPIQVLIADDSHFMRHMLVKLLAREKNIEIIGLAKDGNVAISMVTEKHPDVLLLDVVMPKLNGIEALREIMKICPTPTIILSALSKEEIELTFNAFDAGAVDFVSKPSPENKRTLEELRDELLEKILMCSQIKAKNFKIIRKTNILTTAIHPQKTIDTTNYVMQPNRVFSKEKIIVIASSSGGTRSLNTLLPKISKKCPPILIVQHMPEGITEQFARRLDQISDVQISEAQEGELICPNRVYIARGGTHMKVILESRNGTYIPIIHYEKSPPVNHVRPSADVLFNSVTEIFKPNVVAIVLSGMGSDGADGALFIKNNGGIVIGESQDTALIYGMPKAVENFAEMIPIEKIHLKLLSLGLILNEN